MTLPTDRGKTLRVWGARGSLIGDMVYATPIYAFLRKQFPDCYTYWQVARKVSQAAPLFYNHDLIDCITISDCNEGMGLRDAAIAQSCHVRINTTPQHPDGDIWPNLRSMAHEVFRMAGLSDGQWDSLSPDEQRPRLYQWFEVERKPKTIAIWPGARQGERQKRVPDVEYWDALVVRLVKEGYQVMHCGHPNDLNGRVVGGVLSQDARHGTFLDQIRASLGCDLIIGTDSGSQLALSSYESVPTLSLLTNHWPLHVDNPLAFSPCGARNVSMFSRDNHNGHDIENVVDTIKQLT